MLDMHSAPSKFLKQTFSCKSGKVLNLGPICLKIDFSCKTLKPINVKLVLSASKLTGLEISK